MREFREIGHLRKKSWQLEICTQVNVIPLNDNLSCYSVINKAESVMSKRIETIIINYALCIRFKLNLLRYHKAPERKFSTSQFVRNHEVSVIWKTGRS